MDLEKQLKEQGYNRAKADVATFIEMRDALRGMLANAPPERVEEGRDLLALMDAKVIEAEKVLADEYAKTIAYVDANNDAELTALQIEEIAELAAEELDKTNPEAADRARAIMRNDPDA